ncbi:MAG: FtsW-like cell division membrane protein CA_C0505, partial [uncultured Frankineae bacterium]
DGALGDPVVRAASRDGAAADRVRRAHRRSRLHRRRSGRRRPGAVGHAGVRAGSRCAVPARPPRGALRRAARRPVAAAVRRSAERPGARRDPPPRLRGCGASRPARSRRAGRGSAPAAGLDRGRGRRLPGRPARRPGPHPTAALHLHRRRHRSGAAAAARSAGARTHDQRSAAVDPGRSLHAAAERGRQAPAHPVLRRLPRRQARRPVPRQPPGPRSRPAPCPRPRPRAAGVGRQPRGAGARPRPRQLAAVLRAVRRHALRRHRAHELAGHRRRAVPRRCLRRLPAVLARAAARRHLARPVRGRRRCGVPAGAVAVRVRHRGADGHGARRGTSQHGAVRQHRLHHGRHRRGARPGRRHGGAARLRAHRRERAADGAVGARLLRQAPRRGPVVLARPAGLRHRRRGHGSDPPHRRHPSLAVVRRVVHRGQLGPRRGAAADQRCRPAPRAGAGDPRPGARSTGLGRDPGGPPAAEADRAGAVV